ncbi:hypothetical protein HDU97_002354 [Phlyctochytrium planicorne]|nr:hypothetical protein HDU97_002354 [Phlyctochytrium planicorne]
MANIVQQQQINAALSQQQQTQQPQGNGVKVNAVAVAVPVAICVGAVVIGLAVWMRRRSRAAGAGAKEKANTNVEPLKDVRVDAAAANGVAATTAPATASTMATQPATQVALQPVVVVEPVPPETPSQSQPRQPAAERRDEKQGTLFRNPEASQAPPPFEKCESAVSVPLEACGKVRYETPQPSWYSVDENPVVQTAGVGNREVEILARSPGGLRSWSVARVAITLSSAGVESGVVEMLRDNGANGSMLLGLDDEKLKGFGMAQESARRNLLVVVAGVVDKYGGGGGSVTSQADLPPPPKYAEV